MGVADVGQVVYLGTFVDLGVLDLDKVADAYIFGQFCAGAQTGVGANNGPAGYMAPFQMRKCADLCIAFDGHAGAEDNIRLDLGIAADHGTRTAHWVMLARSLEIPTVCGMGVVSERARAPPQEA